MADLTEIRLKVLLVSRRKDTLDSLQALLGRYPGITLERKLVVNGHTDPLHGVAELPDALVLHLGETWRAELEGLAARAADRRPPLVVVGSAADAAAMRLAMQAGARDLLPMPLIEADLVAALKRIERDRQAAAPSRKRATTVFINAKGGCGGTFLACNVAHTLATRFGRRVVLLDLDLQFGTIPVYFDLFPVRGLLQALENVEGLDETALDGYLARHPSGLAVLGQAAQDCLPLGGVSLDSVTKLIRLLERTHDHLLIDLPRNLNAMACRVIERAENVALIVQQSVTVLRDAGRLTTCLRRDLAVSSERIATVINRYDRRSAISAQDIQNTLTCGEPVLVPNDYRNVEESITTGQPLLSHGSATSVAKAIQSLAQRLDGEPAEDRRGLLARAFSRVARTKPT